MSHTRIKPGENYEHDQPCTNPKHAGQTYAQCGHTPGPWTRNESTDGIIIGATKRVVARVIDHPGECPPGRHWSSEDEANALLISQAPAMAKSLYLIERIWHTIENAPTNPELHVEMWHAIQEARAILRAVEETP